MTTAMGWRRLPRMRRTKPVQVSDGQSPIQSRASLVRLRTRATAAAGRRLEGMTPMTKRQLIDEIRKYNPTAQVTFLSQFDEDALQQYLDHLQFALGDRTKRITWVRRGPKLRMVS